MPGFSAASSLPGDQSLTRRDLLKAGGAIAGAVALGVAGEERIAQGQVRRIRWDIVSLKPEGAGVGAHAGGEASARSVNGVRITLTGNGTFLPGTPRDVTGGGTFKVAGPTRSPIFDGNYRVTELLYWQREEGRPPPIVVADHIGGGDPSAGLAILRIAYPGGADGILVVSCQLAGTNPGVFEGVFATHTTLSFYNAEGPQAEPFVDANRTLFHIAAS
jgi:hypothetical protein